MQEHHIQARIFEDRENGLTVMVDETSDVVDNNEPINVVIITSEAAYYVDTFLIPEDRDNEEKYPDAFGKAFNNWLDKYFTAHEAPDSPLLRYSVSAFVTDNVNCNISTFRRHWAHKFPNAKHIRCVAHMLNLVGCLFKVHPALAVL